jgi:hypothetical protein
VGDGSEARITPQGAMQHLHRPAIRSVLLEIRRPPRQLKDGLSICLAQAPRSTGAWPIVQSFDSALVPSPQPGADRAAVQPSAVSMAVSRWPGLHSLAESAFSIP